MATMLDYLDWRGDIGFAAVPFNRVDNLILAYISYVPLDGLFPASGRMTVQDAALAFFAQHTEDEVHAEVSFVKNSAFVLKKAGESMRFGSVLLSHYVSHTCTAAEEQFAALCAHLPGGATYVAYRGTDDTLVGWKEDFNMSFQMPVPSQLAAVAYLEDVAKTFRGALLLGGHSKGGNLAVYAAVHCADKLKKRIVTVYNNDGPGFDSATAQSAAYRAMLTRIDTIVPQSSIIGMLLEHEDTYAIVKSSKTGLMQHDPTSWQVLGAQFETVAALDDGAKLLDASLHAWLGKLDKTEREAFVDTLFTILGATNASTVGELAADAWQSIGNIATALTHMDAESRVLFKKAMGLLLAESTRVVKEHLEDRKLDARKPAVAAIAASAGSAERKL